MQKVVENGPSLTEEMVDEEILKKVKLIIAEYYEVPEKELKLETDIINDFQADSLDVIEFIFKFETEFRVSIPIDMIDNISDIKSITLTIQKILLK